LLSFLFPSGEANRIEFYLIVFSCPLRVDSLPKKKQKKTPLTLEDPEQEPRCSKCFLLFLFCFSLRVKKRNKSEKNPIKNKEEEKVKRKNVFFIILCVPVERFH
jgi:hypothetical protein